MAVALAAPGSADASTVTATGDGTVVFAGKSGERALLSFRAVEKSPSQRSVHRVTVVDVGASVLIPRGRCRRGAGPRVAVCVARPSRRLRRFLVLLRERDDRLGWWNFAHVRNTDFLAHGGSGADVLRLPSAGDRLYGGAGDDRLTGGAGGDKLYGGDGNDILGGAAGRDLLEGGTGDDALLGGRGIDRLSGQLGNDAINSADGTRETVLCGGGRDAVLRDRIDVASRQHCERIVAR